MQPVEVFLSHSSDDHEMAARLARMLAAHGVPVFFSPTSILGAQQWQDEILKALQRCDWFLVLLSPSAVESMWVKREIAIALNDRRYENRIISLDYLPCDLTSIQWLTLFQKVDLSRDPKEGCRELLRTWGIGLQTDLVF